MPAYASLYAQASTLAASDKVFGLRLWGLKDSTALTAYGKLQEAMLTSSIFDTGFIFSIDDLNGGISVELTESQKTALGNISNYSNLLVDLYVKSTITTTITFNANQSSITFTGGFIPEPSTYAAIFGLLTLGFVAYRKRK